MTKQCFSLWSLLAGHGDSLWIEYGDRAAPNRIIVDGGTKGTAKRLEPALVEIGDDGFTHELLVITHIDDDHIAGVLALLEKGYINRFREVWFNGRAHLNPGAELEEYGAAQGERLTTALLTAKKRWNQAFDGEQVALTETGDPQQVTLPNGMEITVLSPGWPELTALAKVWDREVDDANLNPKKPLIFVPNPDSEFEGFGAEQIDVDDLADEDLEEDDKEANCSSIVLLLKYLNMKMLLGADAKPSVMVEAIKKFTGGEPLPVDIFKLPHHGSRNNVSKELLELVPSKKVVISTNGAYHQHPDLQAIARVIKYSPRGVELVFNCRTKFNEMWSSSKLQKKWGYTAVYGGEEGAFIELLDVEEA